MVFKNILIQMENRIKELSKLEKELYTTYAVNDLNYKPGYDELIEKIEKSKGKYRGKFFFEITNIQNKPRIKISASELKVPWYPKLLLSLESFADIKVFEKETIKQIKKENRSIEKRKEKEAEEYNKYLQLKKEFENE